MAPDKVKVPTPNLVRVTLAPAMIPLIVPAPVLVMESALLVCKLMAVALKVSVEMVRPVNPVTPPITSLRVVLPVVVMLKVLAPLTVLLNLKVPAPALSVVAAFKVTASP